MRILHTSDWHLGRSFHRADLLAAQAAFVDHLVDVVRQEQVDLVLVAGDVYDRALPPVDAVEVAHDALRRLAAERVRTVVTSGNHDSARRLGFGSELMDFAGVHLRTDAARVGVPVLVDDDHGQVAVYGLPYLEPTLTADLLGAPDRTHSSVLGAAMDRVRADLAGRPGARSVVMAHAFVTGAVGCESERDVSIGGAASVPLTTFAGVDYVALGHLHGRQTLAPTVRYSGSPLPYSFSEASHTKGMWLVDIAADGAVGVEPVDTVAHRGLARLRGRLDDLLADRRWDAVADHYLHVTLTDPARPREPMERLRARFPHVLVLGFEPDGVVGAETGYAAKVAGLDDLAVCCSFVAHVRGAAPDDAERAVLDAALEAGRLAEAAR